MLIHKLIKMSLLKKSIDKFKFSQKNREATFYKSENKKNEDSEEEQNSYENNKADYYEEEKNDGLDLEFSPQKAKLVLCNK